MSLTFYIADPLQFVSIFVDLPNSEVAAFHLASGAELIRIVVGRAWSPEYLPIVALYHTQHSTRRKYYDGLVYDFATRVCGFTGHLQKGDLFAIPLGSFRHPRAGDITHIVALR